MIAREIPSEIASELYDTLLQARGYVVRAIADPVTTRGIGSRLVDRALLDRIDGALADAGDYRTETTT